MPTMSASDLISIQQFIHQVPHTPAQNSELAGWQDITLLKFSLPPGGEVDVPGLAENILFMSLCPKIQYESRQDNYPRQRVLYQGDIAITPAGYSRHWRWLSLFSAANLFIPPSLIKECSQDLVKGDPDSVYLIEHKVLSIPFLSSVVTELLAELESGSPYARTYIDTLTHSLAMYLVMHHSSAKLRETTTLLKPDNAYVSCAIDFIQDNLGEDLRLAAIASACNVSINHLCLMFKQSVGQSVHQFVIEQRLERAKSLLKNSKKPLVDIAQETGFSNQAHFTNSFRKTHGIPPDQYRKKIN